MSDARKEKRNTWGKTPSGTHGAVNFYGHLPHPDGLVAYVRVTLSRRMPFKLALPLAEALLPEGFMKISTVKGGDRAFRARASGGRIEKLTENIQITHQPNAG